MPKPLRLSVFTILGLLVVTKASAAATEPPESLFDLSLEALLDLRVVEAASGYTQGVAEVPASVTVVQEEEWRTRGARDLWDAIDPVAGVHLTLAGTGVAKIRPSMRGMSGDFGEQILVLIDGVPFKRVQDAGVFFSGRIPLAAFKRVEVVKGPGSAVYGADAVGGVINLVSYRPSELPTTVTVRAGTFDTLDLGATVSERLGQSQFSLVLEYQRSGDDPDRTIEADLQTALDTSYGTDASRAPGPMKQDYEIGFARAQWEWERIKLGALLWRNFGSGLGAGVAQALDPDGWARSGVERFDLDLDLTGALPGELTLRATHYHERTETFFHVLPAGTRLPIGADGNVDFAAPVGIVDFPAGLIGTPGGDASKFTLSLIHLFEPSADHLVRWQAGVEWQDNRGIEKKNFGPGVIDGLTSPIDGRLTDVTGTPFVYMPAHARRILFFSLHDEWKITDDLSSSVGVRFDHFSDFGSSTNPRAGLRWRLSELASLRVFGGTAFRAPSFTDLYAQNNPAGVGNPDLDAEKSWTFDGGTGLDLRLGSNLSLNFAVFRYASRSLVQFVNDPATGFQVARNVGREEGEGFEVELLWRPSTHLSVEANFSKLEITDEHGGAVPDVPRQMAYAALNWRPFENCNLHFGAKLVGDRARAADDPRPPVDDYVLGRFRAEYETGAVRWGLSVTNVLDGDAREPSNGSVPGDYPLPGREILLDLVYGF